MNHSKRGLSLLLLLLLLALPARAQETFTAKVVGVTDGDTITVLTAARRQVKVRLHGIDAPESHQDYGTRSKQFTSERVFGKSVRVKVRDTDRYGRSVAEIVTADGRSLNQEAERAGMAWWYRRYAPNDRTLQAFEEEAQRAKRGLWADRTPIPPWEFRRNGRGNRAAIPSGRAADLRPAAARPSSELRTTTSATAAVYVTRTGKKFHRDGCRYLSFSQVASSRDAAEKRGLTPCSVCRP